MATCSMSSRQYVHPIISAICSTQHSPTHGNDTNQKTDIKFSIDEILKPSFGRFQMKENNPRTSLILDVNDTNHISLGSEFKTNYFCNNCEETVRDISLYDNSVRNVGDNDLNRCHISHREIIHERSIKQPIDISYLFNFHLANYQLGGAVDKQKEFYLPYGFHIGTQLHFMEPFSHLLHGLYARCYGNYINDINNSRFEEKKLLDNTVINSSRTCQDDEMSNQNMFQNICSTKDMHDQFQKFDHKHSKRIDLNDDLSNSRNSVIPTELVTPNCSTNFTAHKPTRKQKIYQHASSSIKHIAYDKNRHPNSATNPHVASSTKSVKVKDSVLKMNDLKTLPAWVFCTRYSDRPSSGPRYRKTRQKTKTELNKRPRTAFTSQQLQCLKSEFDACPYLCEQRRNQLSAKLGLSESQVKIWFQNKRAKLKKRSGRQNSLAMRLMEEGLYNHSTIITDDGSDQDSEMDNSII